MSVFQRPHTDSFTLAVVFILFKIKYSPPMPEASATSPRSLVGKPEVLAPKTVTLKSHYNSSRVEWQNSLTT
jgi:hypothetical protein